jgi:hypothetical protein
MNETLHFPKAEPFLNHTPAGDLTLLFDQRLPDFTMVVDGNVSPAIAEKSRLDYYKDHGREIANALLRHLPGGLVDGLLVALLDHKRSQFCVPMLSPDEGGGQ